MLLKPVSVLSNQETRGSPGRESINHGATQPRMLMIICTGTDDSELDIPCVPLRHTLQEPPVGSPPAR